MNEFLQVPYSISSQNVKGKSSPIVFPQTPTFQRKEKQKEGCKSVESFHLCTNYAHMCKSNNIREQREPRRGVFSPKYQKSTLKSRNIKFIDIAVSKHFIEGYLRLRIHLISIRLTKGVFSPYYHICWNHIKISFL